VVLFDAVGFSLFSPLEQVAQLNSLAYSVNSAYSKLLDQNIEISFARITTGDGFYVWNRRRHARASIEMYLFMHLVIADNAIARGKTVGNTTPLLRTCFHVGGHYEFYQSEGLSPTTFSYIVGDVTIELARMIEVARPGQILVGDFPVREIDAETDETVVADTVSFVDRAQETLTKLNGLELSGDHIESIKCYLTGAKQANDGYSIKRYRISDKHGLNRYVYNAKVNIYRSHADPIYLGLQDADLTEFGASEPYVGGVLGKSDQEPRCIPPLEEEYAMTKRRRFTADFRARVAVEALRGDKTVQEIAAKHKVHPNQVSSWKRQAVDGLSGVFSNGADRAHREHDGEVGDLHATSAN
jgi:hypothetical protein